MHWGVEGVGSGRHRGDYELEWNIVEVIHVVVLSKEFFLYYHYAKIILLGVYFWACVPCLDNVSVHVYGGIEKWVGC